MATSQQAYVDPYRNFKWILEIDGFAIAGFSRMSGLKMTTDVIEYREGGMNSTPHLLPGQTRFDRVTLEHGQTANVDMLNAARQVFRLDGTGTHAPIRSSCSLVQRGLGGSIEGDAGTLKRWNIFRAWFPEYETGEYDGKGSDVLIERLVMAHEGFELDTAFAPIDEPAKALFF